MYLSKIHIRNFRGIKQLTVGFDKKLNVIIGANGQLKILVVLMGAAIIFQGNKIKKLEAAVKER